MTAGGKGAPKNLFGTDGVRDLAGSGVLAPASLARLGSAIVETAGNEARGRRPPRVLFGRDTRPSGAEIERVLAAELAAGACEVASAGVITTPAVSLLLQEGRFDLGIVVSASHNPARFNGVKVLDRYGHKLATAEEEAITARYYALPAPPARRVDRTLREDPDLRDAYRERLQAAFDPRPFLRGLKIVLDCAHGAAAPIAPAVFAGAGAEVVSLFAELDGAKINDACGSTHPGALAAEVVREKADLGIAFDGDGDRAILVDDRGQVCDGDDVLAIWGLYLREKRELARDCIVATVMSNAGMESYLRDHGIQLVRTPVGDREVVQALIERGAVLGGEQSGHIVYLNEARTGDGIRTGLHMARIVRAAGMPLSELRRPIPRFPQVLLAVPVRAKPPLADLPRVRAAVAAAERSLGGRGRVLVRYSGTEPIARVLVEGPERGAIATIAEAIAEAIRAHDAERA